jgi:hypothetical protein
MSLMGLGCVKTGRRGEPIEWNFRQIAISAVRILERSQFRSIRERSFSSFSSFWGFHTAWVISLGGDRGQGPVYVRSTSGRVGNFVHRSERRHVPGGDLSRCSNVREQSCGYSISSSAAADSPDLYGQRFGPIMYPSFGAAPRRRPAMGSACSRSIRVHHLDRLPLGSTKTSRWC